MLCMVFVDYNTVYIVVFNHWLCKFAFSPAMYFKLKNLAL